MSNTLCSISDINKSFSGIQVLFDINFDISKGEVVGLAGENGAGKSTLMKIISGMHIQDSGKVRLQGEEIPYGNPLEIQKMGVSVVYQEFSLIPQLSVAENLFMRQMSEEKRFARVDWNKMYERADEFLNGIGATGIDPRKNVNDIGIAQKQFVEIAKALTIEPKLLLMDEPSATLNSVETENLYKIVNHLKSQGVSVVYITHRLEEFFETCDRLVVLKDGVLTDNCGLDGLCQDDIITKMVGRDMEDIFEQKYREIGDEVVLSVRGLQTNAGVHNIDFDLRKGEILGVAGLNGAGRSEMIRGICGLDEATVTEMKINGKDVKLNGIEDAIEKGLAYLPEERKTQGLVLSMSVKENISYASLDRFCNNGVIKGTQESEACDKMIESLQVKCSGPNQLVKNLSGGNQQKVIIGKWMLNEPDIYLMDEPTRGIDVGAKQEIYDLMRELTEKGASVVFVSSELPELLGVCDRIIVMAGGTLTGEVDAKEATEESVMSYAFVSKEKEGA